MGAFVNEKKTLIAALREAIQKYNVALLDKSGEEKDDLLRVAGHAEVIADSMDIGDIDRAKLFIYALSRQISDSFYPQPPEFKELSSRVTHIRKFIFRKE